MLCDCFQVLVRGGEVAPGMVDAVLHRRLRVGGSPALAARAVALLEAVQAGRTRCPLARLPGALVGATRSVCQVLGSRLQL